MEKTNWEWFDKIERTPAYIETLKNFELEDLSLMVASERNKTLAELARVTMANPDREIPTTMFPMLAKLDFLESTLNAEKKRRAGLPVLGVIEQVVRHEYAKPDKPQIKKEKPQPDPLPDFEEMLRPLPQARLPYLWKHLMTKEGKIYNNPKWFDGTGYSGGDARHLGPLYGISVGLRQCGYLKPGFSERDIYQALCKKFNVTPSKSPSSCTENTNFKDVLEWVNDFVSLPK